MFKLLGWLILFVAGFTAGYYAGQNPVEELQRSVSDLTRSVLDVSTGLQRTVRLRHGLVDGKAHVVEAKAELLDKNYGNAATALAQAIESLERASAVERETRGTQKVRPLLEKVREVHLELSMGRPIPRTKLDDIQKELDALLAPPPPKEAKAAKERKESRERE
ncbi:MAG: hypothetical protein FJ249_05180 [Nitrospira sp.]|nr:hypothetical protein [Nitrospira sp.]